VTDWDTVIASLSTLGAAVVGGGVGYLGARLQAKSSHDQAQITLRQIDVESERRRQERLDESVAESKEIYWRFLDHERWLAARMTTGIQLLGRDDYLTWLDGYNHRFNELLLSATDGVRAAVEAVDEQYASIYADESTDLSEKGFQETVRAAFISHNVDVSAARERMVEAMRRDAAP
jgi:hypothetical protein